MKLKPIHHRIIKMLKSNPDGIDTFDLWRSCELYTMNEIEGAISELPGKGYNIVHRLVDEEGGDK